MRAGSPKVPEGCPLSPRRFEILQLLGEGLVRKEIAARLGIAPSTVRTATHELYRTLGCTNVTQAVAEAGRHGWIGWVPPEEVDDLTPLALDRPFLAAYLQHLGRWPAVEPDERAREAMDLALAGNRLHPPT